MFGNMGNMGKMLQQAKAMQDKMKKAQQEISEKEMQGSAAGGKVQITMTGDKRPVSVKIDPSVVNLSKEDAEMLEDLIFAALSDCSNSIDEFTKKIMTEATGGILPEDFKLPF